MVKVLFNTHNGYKREVLDFKETKKRFKIVDLDGSYSLWTKDPFDAKVNILIEGKDIDDVDKKFDKYVIDNINSEFKMLLDIINFETLATLLISVVSYQVIFRWINFDGTGTESSMVIRIPQSKMSDDEPGRYHKILSDLIHKNIISRKDIYRKKFRSKGDSILIKDPLDNNYIDTDISYLYPPFSGLYIHKVNISERLPERMNVGVKYTLADYRDNIPYICTYIPKKFSNDSLDYTSEYDLRIIPFAINEISEISKSVKVIKDDESYYSVQCDFEAIIVLNEMVFICKKDPNSDKKYEYVQISRSAGIIKVLDKISELKNNKKTFQFISSEGNFRIYASEDFIFDELMLVENKSAMYEKFIKFKSSDIYRLSTDYLSEFSHLLPLFLSEMKKHLGQKFNIWMLMNKIQ